MKRDEIRKLFNDNSDSWEIKNDGSMVGTMTIETFTEVVEQLQNAPSNIDYAKCPKCQGIGFLTSGFGERIECDCQ